jgi:hypothetical protein
MIKHNFLLCGILELKLNPRRLVYVEIPKPSRVSLKLRQNPRLTPNAEGFDYILAPPSRVLVSQHRPSASGLIP